jgi:hypothetical protein
MNDDAKKVYVGYHDDADLPIQRGDKVRIRKGTMVKRIGKPASPAARTFTVVVDHTLCGSNSFAGNPLSNPSVRWAGSGGYWAEVDINEAEKVE